MARHNRAERYRGTKCAVPSCSRTTRSFSRYCQAHYRRQRVFGHVLAKPVPPAELNQYVGEVARVLVRNPEHRGIALAVKEVDALLEDMLRRHANGEKLAPDAELWLGMAHAGVKPRDIIVMFLAAVAYEQLAGNAAPNEAAYYTRVCRAILSLDKLKARTSGGHARELGGLAQRAFGQTMLNRYVSLASGVVDAIRAGDQKAHERRAVLTLPLR